MAGNANSGRRPRPTALKLLRGEKNKDRINQDEPKPPALPVVKPAGMSAVGSTVWDEIAPVCLAMGTLTAADVRPFATMCELQATMQQASAAKDAEGFRPFLTRREDPEDEHSALVVVIDAVLKLERDTAAALRPYYALFGLEPTSRARIKVPKAADKPASRWAGMGVVE